MSSDEQAPQQKSSSEILNELFSTFDTSELKKSKKKPKKDKKLKKKKKQDESSDIEIQLKKARTVPSTKVKKKSHKDEVLKIKKKVKIKSSSSSSSSPTKSISSPTKKKKKKKVDLEDGEILEDDDKKKKKKKPEVSHPGPSSTVHKMSASQAFKMDEEERLLLGYVEDDTEYKRRSSRDHDSSSRRNRSRSPTSSSSSRHHRSRSRSPPPRLAPPRDSYKRSYMKFKKQSSLDYDDNNSSSRSYSSESSSRSSYYDSEKYYDYHSKRSRTDYSSSKMGFGYVSSKSYYYDDVEEPSRDYHSRSSSSSSRRDRDSRDSSRDSRGYGTSAWRHRDRSISPPSRRSYYHPDDILDKSELLEIARKNAKKLMQRGVLPSDIFSRDQILALKAGGKSVEELTHYCKRLAKRDAAGSARSDDSGDSDDDGGSERRFIHHPFQVKDRPLPTITLNIRNSVPLPVRTPQELAIESAKLRTQFPVSSGTQHRFKEIEWKPVEEDKNKSKDDLSKALVPLDGNTKPETDVAAITEKEAENENGESTTTSSGGLLAIEAPPPAEDTGGSNGDDTGISVDGPDLPLVDISSVIGLRLKAMRTLQENPMCEDAKKQLDEATKMMKNWADAKALEPKFLTPAELQSGPQAWAKRDQLRKTKKLDSGMGMHLLQKMGWRPGEGLGKNKEGSLEPLALDVKTDKKGLTAAVEELMYGKSRGGGGSSSSSGPSMPVVYDLSGKHPVSALMELTAKRRWGAPEFELCFEHGPSHKKQFVYKVIVNGVEYQPCVAVGNKKQAKANAAAFCLQSLGLLPTAQLGPNEMLQTVVPEVQQQQPPQQPQSTNPLAQQFTTGSLLKTVKDPEPCPPPLPMDLPASALMPPPPPPPSLLPSFANKTH